MERCSLPYNMDNFIQTCIALAQNEQLIIALYNEYLAPFQCFQLWHFFLRKLSLFIKIQGVHFFLRYLRLYRTVRKQGQSMEIYIFCETQWRCPWYVESTLMNIVYFNISFAILPFWISKENAAWCWLVTPGSSSLDRNHLNFGNLFAAFSF